MKVIGTMQSSAFRTLDGTEVGGGGGPASIEVRVADPATADLFAGRVWFNRTTKRLKFYDGTHIRSVQSQKG